MQTHAPSQYALSLPLRLFSTSMPAILSLLGGRTLLDGCSDSDSRASYSRESRGIKGPMRLCRSRRRYRRTSIADDWKLQGPTLRNRCYSDRREGRRYRVAAEEPGPASNESLSGDRR